MYLVSESRVADGEGGSEVLVGGGEAGFEADDRLPAGGFDFCDVEEFARGAVGFGGVGEDFAGEAGGSGDELGEFEDGEVGAGAGAELEEHRLSLGEIHDGRHGVLYAVDEACGALWSRLNTNVEPDWRVERHLLIDKQVRQLCNERGTILF